MLNKLKKQIVPLSFITTAMLTSACGSSDNNIAPVINGLLNPVVAENTTLVGTYSITDEDNVALSLSGESSDLFSISQTGELSFINAPDFEDRSTFSVTIVATDDGKGNLSTELEIEINIGDVRDTPAFAVVQTVAPDFSSSEVVTMDATTQQVTSGYYIKSQSDYTVSSYENSVYHIGRFGIDTIDKYSTDALDTAVWEYSTQDNQVSTSSNPYTLVSLSSTKAYLIRYGSDKVWIVNPEATQIDDFKIGELDLSSYVPDNNTKNTPNPSAGIIVDGKLFITMQRFSDAFAANSAYVAVFDTTTDEEIETNHNTEDTVKGILLTGLNPLANGITSTNSNVYITTRNAFSASDLSLSQIEEINTASYNLRTVLSASDIAENSSAFLSGAAIVSDTKGYLVANETFFEPSFHEISTIYQFNPTTGDITGSNIADSGTEDINHIALDDANFLWIGVGNPEMPGVDIINTETNTKETLRLETELNPSAIVFAEQ